MPVVSPYALADLPAAQAAMRAAGINPADVTLACATDNHADCPGRVEQKRPCQCPACPAPHGTTRTR